MQRTHRYWTSGIVFTVIMVALISFAVTDIVDLFFIVILLTLITGVTTMYLLFPGSGFFCIALANFLAVYTCLFVFFVEINFEPDGRWPPIIAYMLPIFAFNVGAFLRRRDIRAIVTEERVREKRHPERPFRWLVPVLAIGILSFFLPALDLSADWQNGLLVASMAAIAGIVLVVSRTVAIFLIDVGLMFEEFFRRMAAMILPAVGFFTMYSINIVVFACIYRIIDRYAAVHNFTISGVGRDITFTESLYFSIITLSTVGYGEIVPSSDVVRVIVAVQIVLGVLLLLFGFYEIMSYARRQGPRANGSLIDRDGQRQGGKAKSKTSAASKR